MAKKFLKNVVHVMWLQKVEKNKIGPALYGVLGRKSASISDYKYSKALIAHGKNWSYEEMNGLSTQTTSSY